MLNLAVYAMVYLGAALMVFNIYGFVRYARFVRGRKGWDENNHILYAPIALLVLFLLGYLAVGIFGKPDLIVSGILFGGSIFVQVMVTLLRRVTRRIIEGEHREAEMLAAEESNRVKSSFLASVSHEMRTPMNVILGLNGMALKDPDLRPETRTYLEKIGHSARLLLGLIDNTLDLQRIETGALTIQEEDFSMRDLLDQIEAVSQALAVDKGLTWKIDAADGVMGGYTADATQLKRVLMCLIDNAVKYTSAPGSVQLSVDCVESGDEARTLSFAVSDTGIGIDPEFLPKVFELFAQEDSTFTNRFGGSGVGLTVARRITECMGGHIAANSQKGKGSTFTVTVPLKRCAQQEAPAAQAGVDSLEDRRILIVDDIEDNAEIAADLLELEGAITEWAENGQAALSMVEQHADDYYDAVLMDLRMPIMDGLEAAKRIRALDRPCAQIPIIALTANAFESDVKRSLDAGMNEHLVKPVDADKLYEAMKRHIRPR